MALIKCPECNNMVSDMANICIHCGYPIKEMKSISGSTYNVILYEFGNAELDITRYLMDKLRCKLVTSVNICNNIPYMIMKNIPQEAADQICQDIAAIGGIAKTTKYNPETDENTTHVFTDELRCPHCGSTQVSIGKRGATLTLGLIGSNKTVNRCGKCGYTWKP